MEYEVTGEIQEQSKSVVIQSKVKITASPEDLINEEYLSRLLDLSSKACIGEYQRLRPFADKETVRKQG